MGQRHQIYIIARCARRHQSPKAPDGSEVPADSKPAYRCLMDTHYQWHYGARAIGSVSRLVAAFRDPFNAQIVASELKSGPPTEPNPYFAEFGDEFTEWSKDQAVSTFVAPYTVQLAATASLQDERDGATGAHHIDAMGLLPSLHDNNDVGLGPRASQQSLADLHG